MSEISVLSNQYIAIVNTTDQVNNSIIALKKRFISTESDKTKSAKIKVSEGEFKFATEYLSGFLSNLMNIHDGNSNESEYLPEIFIKEFKNKIGNIDPYFNETIKEIIKLISTDKNLNKTQFSILDKLASVLDNERTVLFRKLRTARG